MQFEPRQIVLEVSDCFGSIKLHSVRHNSHIPGNLVIHPCTFWICRSLEASKLVKAHHFPRLAVFCNEKPTMSMARVQVVMRMGSWADKSKWKKKWKSTTKMSTHQPSWQTLGPNQPQNQQLGSTCTAFTVQYMAWATFEAFETEPTLSANRAPLFGS